MVSLSEDAVTLVRKLRLRWCGHVLRWDEGDGSRRALECKVEGVTGVGHLWLGWREQVEKDRVTAGLRGVEANNRDEWRNGVVGFHLK